MAKEKSWNFEVEGVPYKVELKSNKVSVNGGEPVKLNKLKRSSSFWETHYTLKLSETDGKEAELHIGQLGRTILSYNGRDCATGEAYAPMKVPGWAWIFVVLHALDFFLLLGGALGAVVQVVVIMAMGSVSSNTKMSTGLRVLACVGIWLLSTVVQFFLALWFASLLY